MTDLANWPYVMQNYFRLLRKLCLYYNDIIDAFGISSTPCRLSQTNFCLAASYCLKAHHRRKLRNIQRCATRLYPWYRRIRAFRASMSKPKTKGWFHCSPWTTSGSKVRRKYLLALLRYFLQTTLLNPQTPFSKTGCSGILKIHGNNPLYFPYGFGWNSRRNILV